MSRAGAIDPGLEREALEILGRAIAIKAEPEVGIFEGELAAFYADLMRGFGMTVELFEVVPGRPNLVGRVEGSGGGRSILFNGHLMNPVSRLSDWVTDPYKLVLRDGKMYALGVSDIKAGAVAMILAAREAQREKSAGDVVVALGAGGEGGGFIGTKAILERGIRADVAVVCEPTELDIVHVQYGAVWIELTVTGKAGLTGAGVNAVLKAISVAEALMALNGTVNERRHPKLPPSRISVNAIQGGDAQFYNVPDRCLIRADRRIVPGETPEGALREIGALLDGLRAKDPELDLSSEVKLQIPPIETAEESLIVRTAQGAIAAVRGRTPELKGIRGFTEAAHIVAAGIPAIVCGPGSTAVIHAPNEYVPSDQFSDAIAVYAEIARRITGGR